MRDFRCDYSVNGVRASEVISAYSAIDAKRIIEARYPNARITWWGVNPV